MSDITGALQVAVALIAVLVVLPRILFPAPKIANGPVDRLVIDAIRITALLIAVVHVLVPLRLFQWTGLMFTAFVWVWFVRIRPSGVTGRRIADFFERIWLAALHLLEAGSRDGNDHVKLGVRRWLDEEVMGRFRDRFAPGWRRRLGIGALIGAPLIVLLGASLVIRLSHPLAHAALPVSDGYVHLAWIKYLYAGELFRDGVYPMGMHAFLGVTDKLMPVTSYELMRFSGAFINTFVVFGIYVVSVRASRNAAGALIAAATVGLLGTRPELGLGGFRQVATLPQEFAVLFAVAALAMAIEYVRQPTTERLVYLCLPAVIVAMTHPLGSGLVAIVVAAAGLGAAVRSASGRRLRSIVRVGIAGTCATVTGYLWLVIGLAFGKDLYGKINANPISVAGKNADKKGYLESVVIPTIGDSPIRFFSAAGAIIALLAIIGWMRRRDGSSLARVTAALALIGATVVQMLSQDIFSRWYAVRWTEFVLPILPIGLALGLAPLARLWQRRHLMLRMAAPLVAGVLASVFLVVQMPPVMAIDTYEVEYESAAREIGKHIASNPRFSFTAVGPPAWYDRVLGAGYHIQLTRFARFLTMEEANDPSFEIPIATERIFILVEKTAFAFDYLGRVDGGVAQYYDVKARRELMKGVDGWVRTYSRHHAVEIAFEDEEIRIWLIEHEPDKDYADRHPLNL